MRRRIGLAWPGGARLLRRAGQLLALGGLPLQALAQPSVFDAASGVLHIPSVTVGEQVFSRVELRDTGGLSLVLQSAVPRLHGGRPPSATFDAAGGVLRIGQVLVGAQLFQDVSLRHLGQYRFDLLSATPAAAKPQVAAPARLAEVVTSADASNTRSTYDWQLSDRNAPTPSTPVASPFVSLVDPGPLRIRGGSFDPNLGVLIEPSTRHIVFRGEEGLWRITLDREGAGPMPQRISSEPRPGPQFAVAAQSATGDEALVRYTTGSGTYRYSWLSDGASTPPMERPALALGSDLVLPHAELDPLTGAVRRLYWLGVDRVWSTDRRFGDARSVAVPGASSTSVYAIDSEQPSTLRAGFFFRSGTRLFRYDFATAQVRTVYTSPTSEVMRLGRPLVDHEALHVAVDTPSGALLLRCPDAADADCSVLAPASVLGIRLDLLTLHQTRDHLVAPVGAQGTATSIRKADGAVFVLSVPGAASPLFPDWTAAQLRRGDQTAFLPGNRVFYTRTDRSRGNLIGSVNAEGGDLREHAAAPTALRALPATLEPHLLDWRDSRLPVGAVLVTRTASLVDTQVGLSWIDTASGDMGPVLGSVPKTYAAAAGRFGDTVPYSLVLDAAGGPLGHSATVRPTPQAMAVRRVDGFVVGRGAGSLVRLSTYVP